MRVAIIAPPWLPIPPPAYGGTEAVVDTLARGLRAGGHDVLLATTGDATCPVPRTSFHPSAVGVGLGGSLAELNHAIHAYAQAEAFGADVVHDHTLAGPVYSPWAGERPVVATNHGPFDEQLSPYYAAIADHVPIIAISHHQASTAGQIPIAAVIHHGIDTEAVPVGRGEGGYAAFVGRMCPDKGADCAIRVARAAGVPLRIAAKMTEPHERAFYEAEVEPLLGPGVEYIGELDRADTLAFVGSATCLLNTIRWPEPFGMVMLEALAVGTPVVATPCGAAPEIVDDGVTGFLREEQDALAEAVRLAAELDRAACRDVACTRFTAARMVEAHVDVYERAAAGSALVS